MRRLPLPIRGVANATAFADTPAEFAPVGSMVNFWPHDADKDRPRGGQRPGLSNLLGPGVTLGTGPVQGIAEVTLSSTVTGFVIDESTCRLISSGTSRRADVASAQIWKLDRVPSSELVMYEPAGGGSRPVNAVCISPNGQRAYTTCNYDPGTGDLEVAVSCWDLQVGNRLWTRVVKSNEPSPKQFPDRVANTIDCDANHVYVATLPFLVVIRASDGVILTETGVDGWSREIIEARVRPDGRIAVLFDGAATQRTLPGGVVALGTDFGAGVALYRPQPGQSPPIVRERFGTTLPASDPFYEADHGYFRFSEHGQGRPRGAQPTALAVGPDNSIVVARKNQAWGPNGNFPPDGSTPYITLVKISAAGQLLWEGGPEGIKDAHTGWWSGTYFNDLPSTDPTLNAVRVAPNGTIYCGGAVDSVSGVNAYRVDGLTGQVIPVPNSALNAFQLGRDLGGTIRQAAIAVMPSGLVVFGGDRSTGWEGANGANAHLWFLNPNTLLIDSVQDLGAAVSALGVAVSAGNEVVYVTDRT